MINNLDRTTQKQSHILEDIVYPSTSGRNVFRIRVTSCPPYPTNFILTLHLTHPFQASSPNPQDEQCWLPAGYFQPKKCPTSFHMYVHANTILLRMSRHPPKRRVLIGDRKVLIETIDSHVSSSNFNPKMRCSADIRPRILPRPCERL